MENPYKKKLSDMLVERDFLTKRIRETMPKAFPIGSTVFFFKWEKYIVAEVIHTSEFSERIKVRSQTGKEYWIDIYWLQNKWNGL